MTDSENAEGFIGQFGNLPFEPLYSAKLPPFRQRAALSLKELCSLLGIGRSSFHRLIRVGKIKTIQLGGRRLVSIAELERILSGRNLDPRQTETTSQK